MKTNLKLINILFFSLSLFTLSSFSTGSINSDIEGVGYNNQLSKALTSANSTTSFITLWQVSAPDTIIIPINTSVVNNFNYQWVDENGTVTDSGTHTNANGDFSTTFDVSGEYELRIDGSFPIMANYQKDLLLDVSQWGNNEWASMRNMFRDWPGVSFSATDAPNLSQVQDMGFMFRGASLFDSDLDNWDVSNVTFMAQLFNGATIFNGNITTWDVSNVRNFSGAFLNASMFNQDISQWQTGNATDMARMFQNCQSFQGDLLTWDVSMVTNMLAMFESAESFNSDIGSWNVSKVKSMKNMFGRADAFDQNIGSWDVSSVNDMQFMFTSADNFNQPIGDWDVSNVLSMREMLKGATSFNQSLGNWKFNAAVNLEQAFIGATAIDCALWSSSIIGWAINNPFIMDLVIEGPSNTTPYDSTAAIFRDELLALGWSINGTLSVDDCVIEKYWLGTEDTDWENENNWGPSGSPTIGDDVRIPFRIHQPILTTETSSLSNLIIHENADLSISTNGQLNLGG